MARPLCERCQNPIPTCICHAVKPITSRHRIVILQHPSEVTAAKGTVKLIQLTLPQTEVIVGESEADFTNIRRSLEADDATTFVVYPSDEAETVESFWERYPASTHKKITLVFIDGTWKKVHKIRCLNPWLAQFPELTCADAKPTDYHIRTQKKKGGLATIEAVAYVLAHTDTIEVSPLINVFRARLEQEDKFISMSRSKRAGEV